MADIAQAKNKIMFKNELTDYLTDLRAIEHAHNNYAISDAIRNELDNRGSFCIDTANGQEVYHMGIDWAGKRQEFNKQLNEINRRFK